MLKAWIRLKAIGTRPAELGRLQREKLRGRSVWLGLLSAEVAALVLLRLGAGMLMSLAAPAAVLLVFLFWPTLLLFTRLVRATGGWLVRRLLDRSLYRFSLTGLFLLVLIAAVLSAWYRTHLNAIEAERRMLSGTWRVTLPDGTRVRVNGQEHLMHFDQGCTFYAPRDGIGWMDFVLPSGESSPAIYRREGERVVFAQGPAGGPRPTVFEQGHNWCRIHPKEFPDCSGHEHYCASLWAIERVDPAGQDLVSAPSNGDIDFVEDNTAP